MRLRMSRRYCSHLQGRTACSLALSLLPCVVYAGPLEYVITDLGADLAPKAINASGKVAGQHTSNGVSFTWSNGTLTDFPFLLSARDINETGAFVGQTPSGHAAMYNGGLSDFGLSP